MKLLHYIYFFSPKRYNQEKKRGKRMDTIDRRILACLKENARENATGIGAKVGLSPSAVIERIKKLESSGLIQQYTAILNPKSLGMEQMAFINIRLEHPKYYEGFVAAVKAHPCVSECHYIAGDFDFLLKVATTQEKTLEQVLTSVKSIEGVSLTRTMVVLSTNKHEVCLLPDE